MGAYYIVLFILLYRVQLCMPIMDEQKTSGACKN